MFQCPLWVISGHDAVKSRCPLYPRKYFGVSPSKFDEMRKDGRVGPARLIDGRKVWDVRDLDLAFEALPMESNEAAEDWTAAV